MRLNSRFSKISYAAAGLVAGGVLATTLGAQAATVSPSATTSTTSSSTATADPHPGDNGADGVPEANEVHGGALSLSGTVTAVSSSSVTIKTSTATTVYAVTSSSDIDKNGEATVSALVVGDKVTFSVNSANAKQIDKLHAGDETKNRPTGAAPSGPSSNAG
ncbi:MAG TPA: hypothetical protein VGN19_01695 [Pedococcus sp.]|jgi:hypothetical protein|nr:hypothetical protein [Pedococcus sp.]